MKLVLLLYLVAMLSYTPAVVHGKHIVEAIPLYTMMRPVLEGNPKAIQAIKKVVKSGRLSFAPGMTNKDVALLAAMLKGKKPAGGVRFEIARVEGDINGDIVIPGIRP